MAWRPIPNFLQRLQHQCSRTEAGRRGKTSPKDAHPARPARSSRTAPHTPLSSPSSSPAVDFQEESLCKGKRDPPGGRRQGQTMWVGSGHQGVVGKGSGPGDARARI